MAKGNSKRRSFNPFSQWYLIDLVDDTCVDKLCILTKLAPLESNNVNLEDHSFEFYLEHTLVDLQQIMFSSDAVKTPV